MVCATAKSSAVWGWISAVQADTGSTIDGSASNSGVLAQAARHDLLQLRLRGKHRVCGGRCAKEEPRAAATQEMTWSMR